MQEYFFYRKFDQTKEPIGRGRYSGWREACLYLSKQKRLSMDEFRKLFNVEIT